MALKQFEGELSVQVEELAEQECKKLRLLVSRRWRTID